MILDLLKSAAAGMLLHACAALAFGPPPADATAATPAQGVVAAPLACLPPADAALAQLSSNPNPVPAHED